MEVLYPCSAGLDVHKNTVVSCVRQAGSRVRREVHTFGSTTPQLLALVEWLQHEGVTHMAMEATGVYWKPVWHLLDGHFALTLANARQIKNVPGRKSDVRDAEWIAELLAHGLIRSSFVPPAPIQELRDLTRTRKQMVRERAQHVQRLQRGHGPVLQPDHLDDPGVGDTQHVLRIRLSLKPTVVYARLKGRTEKAVPFGPTGREDRADGGGRTAGVRHESERGVGIRHLTIG